MFVKILKDAVWAIIFWIFDIINVTINEQIFGKYQCVYQKVRYKTITYHNFLPFLTTLKDKIVILRCERFHKHL